MMIIYHAVKPFIDGGMILFYVYSYLFIKKYYPTPNPEFYFGAFNLTRPSANAE